jgi:trimeric autotransporter adhesin
VNLTVTSAPSTLTLSANTFNFTSPPSPPPAQTVLLNANGTTPISYTVAAGATWVTVSPSQPDFVLPGEPTTLTITVNPAALAPQATPYSTKITIAGTAGATKSAQTITVNLTVNPLTPAITGIWPPTLPVNGGAQTITIYGTGFYSASVATVQGATAPLASTVLKGTAMLAVIPASLTAIATTLNVTVTNPGPGGASASSPVAVANIPIIGAVASAASYASATVSPGELVTIFGTNIGPGTAALMAIVNGFATTTLGGVSLSIDGQAAPLLYVSQNQVTAQVPYEVSQGPGIQVVLTNGINPPATSVVTVAPTAPGIFTSDGSGGNQAAALNYNSTTQAYSLNSSTNPIYAGSLLILYLTGEGDYNTPITIPFPSHTGYIIDPSLTPLPEVNPLPTVTIGGVNATVNYAGPIVGSILGLLQMNVVVPAGVVPGSAVPVLVSIGGNTSQTGVTIAVHP